MAPETMESFVVQNQFSRVLIYCETHEIEKQTKREM